MSTDSWRAALPPDGHAGGALDSGPASRWRYDAALRKADAARDGRRWADAAEGYRAVLALDSHAAATWIQYGHALKELGRLTAARSAYEQALKLDSSNADTHLQLGHLFKLSGEIPRAVQMYGEALRLQPASADAQRELRDLGARSTVTAILWEAGLARHIARGLAILLRPLRVFTAYLARAYGLLRAIFARVLTAGFSGRNAAQLSAARTAIGRADWISAIRLLEYLQSVWPRNALVARELEHASLRGARELEAQGQLVNACRLWVSYARATGDIHKAARNMARCARNTTRGTSDRKSIAEALSAWNGLIAIDPDSPEARRGIAWCQASLARWAEQAGDSAAAESHWAAYLRILPGDPAGIEGFRRANAANAGTRSSAAGSGLDANNTQVPEAARLLYDQARGTPKRDDKACMAAAALLFEAGAPNLALEFAGEALAIRSSPEAMALAFRCELAMKNDARAAERLRQSIEAGWLASISRDDCKELLLRVAPAALPGPAAGMAAQFFQSDSEVQAALAPHLIAAGAREAVLAAARQAAIDDVWWPDGIIAATAQYLWSTGERRFVLTWLARFWGRSGDLKTPILRFAAEFAAGDAESLAPGLGQPLAEDGPLYLVLAAYFAERGEAGRSLALFERLAGLPAEQLDRIRREWGELLSDTLSALLASPLCTPALRARLAAAAVLWLPKPVQAFFAGGEFESLRNSMGAAAAHDRALISSRRGVFRERFFDHYLERREGIDPGSLASDFALGDVALKYFAVHAKSRPVEQIPVPTWLRERLTKSCLSLGASGNADVLMMQATMRDRPRYDPASPLLFEEISAWYLSVFVPENRIPSTCLSPELVRHFSQETGPHSPLGVRRTRFLDLMSTHSAGADAYRLEIGFECLLFVLHLIATTLPKVPQYRVFLGDAFTAEDRTEHSFLGECISAMCGEAGRQSGVPHGEILSRSREPVRRPAASRHAPHVLLIGHGAADSGLGRNFRMLSEGLAATGAGLATLAYEMEAPAFAQGLEQWHGCTDSNPVAVIAVNAHDIPALFAKDRHGVLNDCRLAGFLLWETSRAPRVQELGVELLDEVWAPTRYVAGIYAQLAPTYVVGKGLFSGDEVAMPARSADAPLNRFQFVTVFDFHSSIERKNPLASVLAFKQAFRAGEDVELVVKASNVDPQHPSNALGQWERLCAASAGDNRIRIVTERYTNEQMNGLICNASCVVSLHRSEGFGYLMSDAMAYGVPVIATGYSGNADFCTEDTCFPVPCRLVPVESMGVHWESAGAQWADPDIGEAAQRMREVYRDYPGALQRAQIARRSILSTYSKVRFARTLAERIEALASRTDR